MYVSDTHSLVYHILNKKSGFGKNAKRIFLHAESSQTVVFVPSIVLWEVVLLMESGRLRLYQSFEHWCRGLQNHSGFNIIALDWLDVNEARSVSISDPFDRLIVGTALRLDMPLITRDQQIVESGLVETIW
jgi:PIN domain nuclease of toxin-antitoxin system